MTVTVTAGGPIDAISVVAILGTGRTESRIAVLCVSHDLRVRLVGADPAALEDARGRVVAGLTRRVAAGRLDPARLDDAYAHLEVAADLVGAVAGADLVIAAATGDMPATVGLFRALDDIAAADTVLATGTSLVPVSACAAVTRRPERVIGLHVVEPDAGSTLVEVAVPARTTERTVERAEAFARSLGGTALRCADSPGLVVDRVGRPFVVEAVRMLEAGQAGVAAVDGALEAAGYPVGPLRLLDRIGLDAESAADEALAAAFGGAPRFGPPALLRRLVEDGRVGRAGGRGFYRYGPDGAAQPDPTGLPMPGVDGRAGEDRPELVPGGTCRSADGLAAEAIVERLELAVINEAYRAVEEGVALPQDVDTAMRVGAGHPRGPFERVAELGIRRVVERLHALDMTLRGTSGDQYEVARLLWQVATA